MIKQPLKTTFNPLQLISTEAMSLFKNSEKHSAVTWQNSRSDNDSALATKMYDMVQC